MSLTFTIHRLDRVGSTNDEARILAGNGAPHGTVVVAREQSAGRGRQARSWRSPPGNLYLSIVLRPDLRPGRLAELSFVAALAVADAADCLLPATERAELKWPNDVLVDGCKIAGILVEQADPGVSIVGVGLNVLHKPKGTRYPAASLTEAGAAGATVDAAEAALLTAFAGRFDSWMARGFALTIAAWLARAHPYGTQLSVHTAQDLIEGTFAGVDAHGALLLRTSGGLRRVVAGDVSPP